MSDEARPEPDRMEGAPHPRDTLNLLGQSRAEDDFLAAYNRGRLHHGWLVTGPRGVGKATLAWRLARFLLATPDAAAAHQSGHIRQPPGRRAVAGKVGTSAVPAAPPL